MKPNEPTDSRQAAELVARWRQAGPALEEIRRRELRALTDAEALAVTKRLLELLPWLPKRAVSSGLVEQQRIFSRLRR